MVPDRVRETGAAQGEVDAGEEGQLAAVVVGLKVGEGPLLTGVLALHAEHAVVPNNAGNQKKHHEQQQQQQHSCANHRRYCQLQFTAFLVGFF